MNYFPEPKSKLKFYKYKENAFFTNDNLFNSIPFHSINIFVPTTQNVSKDYKDILDSDDFTYFLVKQVSASCLVDSVFISNFIKIGSLFLVSQKTDLQCENFISLSSGKLILKLENNIAESLALLKDTYSSKSKNKMYQICIIHVDAEDFVPEKKYYNSVLSELQKIDYLKFDLILKWKPLGDVCCESILTYFESVNIECKPCEPVLKQETTSYIPVPKIEFKQMDLLQMENIVEWIGTQICDIKYAEEEDKFISKFYMPGPSENRKLIKCTLQGFFIADEVSTVIKNTRELFVKDSSTPFAALVLGGYQYCFVDCNEVQEYDEQDKLVCVLISPQYEYCLFTLNV